MSLITTAGIWNNNEEEMPKKTTRRSLIESSDKEMMGPMNYPNNNNNNINTIIHKMNEVKIKNEGDNLMKFTPIEPPKIQVKDETKEKVAQKYDPTNLGDLYTNYKDSQKLIIDKEAFTTKPTELSKDKLMEKINYAIHLLEQQHNQKTDHIFEEFILYGFVGVFVIFVIDSFHKSTKYIR